MSDAPDYLRLEEVSFRDGDRAWLDTVTLAVPAGGALAVVGDSGSGKSLLLKIALGLLVPASGAVRIKGERLDAMGPAGVQAWRRRVGYVPQDGGLVSNLSVFDNVALPLRYHGTADAYALGPKVNEAMDLTGVGMLRDRRPAELDLGQRVRVGLARAFVVDPEALFLDDPFPKLLSLYGQAAADPLADLRRRRPVTLFAVARRADGLGGVVDRVAVLAGGRLVDMGGTGEVETRLRERTSVRRREGREGEA